MRGDCLATFGAVLRYGLRPTQHESRPGEFGQLKRRGPDTFNPARLQLQGGTWNTASGCRGEPIFPQRRKKQCEGGTLDVRKKGPTAPSGRQWVAF
jgi:hypothetical protein